MTFKSVVEMVASRNGLSASFRPKPVKNAPGNGFHINMSPRPLGQDSPDAVMKEAFLAGILKRIREITVFLNSTTESYLRLGCCKAPGYVAWSYRNRSQLIRIPAGGSEYDRIELRSADCMCNPYLAYALLLHAGLDGVEQGLVPPPPTELNMYKMTNEQKKEFQQLPGSLDEAVNYMESSDFVRRILPEKAVDVYRDTDR